MNSGSDWFLGVGFDPLDQAPALIAIVVGLLIWRRHRRDRRARIFLALAATNLLLSAPLFAAAFFSGGAISPAAVNGYIVSAGLISAAIYLHFGLSFPHARPWLTGGRMRWLYVAAVAAGMVAYFVELAGDGGQAIWVEGSFVGLGAAVFLASAAGCVAIHRSYREMTFDERRSYRAPIMGVLGGMIAGIVMDAAAAILFAAVPSADRYTLFTTNVLMTAAELLLPLFFFTAAVKYRLLEHHSQDYVAKL